MSVIIGDPKRVDGVYRANIEGVLSVGCAADKTKRWFEGTVQVTVTDGRLTLSNPEGARNNRIAFIEIASP